MISGYDILGHRMQTPYFPAWKMSSQSPILVQFLKRQDQQRHCASVHDLELERRAEIFTRSTRFWFNNDPEAPRGGGKKNMEKWWKVNIISKFVGTNLIFTDWLPSGMTIGLNLHMFPREGFIINDSGSQKTWELTATLGKSSVSWHLFHGELFNFSMRVTQKSPLFSMNAEPKSATTVIF